MIYANNKPIPSCADCAAGIRQDERIRLSDRIAFWVGYGITVTIGLILFTVAAIGFKRGWWR